MYLSSHDFETQIEIVFVCLLSIRINATSNIPSLTADKPFHHESKNSSHRCAFTLKSSSPLLVISTVANN